MSRFFLICLGGATGTGVRYLIGLGAVRLFGTGFPFGTLAANVLGCFLMGGVMRAALNTTLLTETMRLVIATGFMGGLTTYSAFNYEVTSLESSRHPAVAIGYLGLTVSACLVAGMLGAYASRRLLG